jgi:dTDP-4-amino-4,6-dideoxygalactose transaminase
MHAIPFNKPYRTGNETRYIEEAARSGKISGNGPFTKRCQTFFENKYGFAKCLLTSSCTDALEMAAILLDIQPGDEVIIPAFTFVSTANAFVLRGATIVFADSGAEHPNLDAAGLEALITPRTKAIVPVHYAGMACDMDSIRTVADKYGLWVVEDAAKAVAAYYCTRNGEQRPLGGIGHLAAFSFHETKNITCGEGGMLVINEERFAARAEIIREKGTNRAAFGRGAADQYGWVDIGSSFLPSEITAAYLWAQLEELEEIQQRRLQHWMQYDALLADCEAPGVVSPPKIPKHAHPNAHSYYLVCRDAATRSALIAFLKENGVHSTSHYRSLHRAAFFKDRHDGRALPHADRFTDTLVRLPLFYDLGSEDVARVCALIAGWLDGNGDGSCTGAADSTHRYRGNQVP